MNDTVMFLVEGATTSTGWDNVSRGRKLVRVPNFSILTAAIDTGIHELGIEVTHVILDGAASATQFLVLLSELSTEFRGDVLWITADGSGFLSGATPSDGRVLYRLVPDDVAFYLSASCVARQSINPFASHEGTTFH